MFGVEQNVIYTLKQKNKMEIGDARKQALLWSLAYGKQHVRLNMLPLTSIGRHKKRAQFRLEVKLVYFYAVQ